jgi:Asp-tRNA(Asn)/Glu-tRNA(Gln) amidotransferase A subunit family amidase
MSTAATASLQYLQLTELSELLRTRTVSPVEVTRAQLDRIAALDSKLASYVTVMADQGATRHGTLRARNRGRAAPRGTARSAGRHQGPVLD